MSAQNEGDLRELLLRILIEDGNEPVSTLAARGDVQISDAELEPNAIHVGLAVSTESVEEIEGVDRLLTPDEEAELDRKAAKTSDLTVEDDEDADDE